MADRLGPDRPATADLRAGGDAPRILLVRLSAVGDVLHALPVLSALRAHWPAAELVWAVEDRAASLLGDRAELDRVVVFPRRTLAAAAKRSPRAGWRALRAFLAELWAAGPFDAALDLQGNLVNHWNSIATPEGDRTRFVGETYNASVEPKQSTSFGFCLEY